MKLLCDLDGVIFPVYDELNLIHKHLFDCEVVWEALPDSTHPYWKTNGGKWVRQMFYNELFYAELLAYKGARETLRIWNRENKIIYCTARPKIMKCSTAYSLGRNNLPYGDIVFVKRDNVGKNKLLVAKFLEVDVVIDDEISIVLETEPDFPTLLFTQPYNNKIIYKFRVNDWYDVHRIINTKIGGK